MVKMVGSIRTDGRRKEKNKVDLRNCVRMCYGKPEAYRRKELWKRKVQDWRKFSKNSSAVSKRFKTGWEDGIMENLKHMWQSRRRRKVQNWRDFSKNCSAVSKRLKTSWEDGIMEYLKHMWQSSRRRKVQDWIRFSKDRNTVSKRPKNILRIMSWKIWTICEKTAGEGK